MTRILAVTWDGGGNVPPLTAITTALLGRGHEVRVLGHDVQRSVVEASGAAFVPYRHARPWSSTGPTSGGRRTRDLFAMFTETGPARDVAAELDGPSRPDLVLADCMRLSALRAAVRSDVPTVALVHSFQRFVFRDWVRGPVGLLATVRGLRPAPLWNACSRVLVATDRDLDPAADADLAPNVRYTGVAHTVAGPASPASPPIVLVSLSTIFYPGQAGVLQNVLDGLADLDVRVLAATGPDVDPSDLRAGPNTELHRHLPHDEVMPTASLLIGHGGHATTLRALAHGLPVLVVPLHRFLDQRMIGQAVQDAGAGRVVPTDATPSTIRAAARLLLADDSPHRRAAAGVGARLRAIDGAAAAADEIESLLRTATDDRTTP